MANYTSILGLMAQITIYLDPETAAKARAAAKAAGLSQGRAPERLSLADPASIGIPSIVLHELRCGMLRAGGGTRKRDDLESFLGAIAVLDFDARSADAAAEARLELDRQGQQIGPFGLLIAGTALARGRPPVPHQVREV